MKALATASTSATTASNIADGSDSDLASKPRWELRDFVDLNYASEKAKARKAAKHASDSEVPSEAASSRASLQTRVMSDPKLMAHFIAIKSLLDSDEAAQILALGERMTEEQQEWLVAEVSALSPTEAAALLRTTLVELHDAVPSTESADESRPDGER